MRRIRTEPWGWGALLVGGGLLLGVMLTAPQASADDGAARAVAREHFKRGVTLAKQRAYAEALSEFQQAYAAVPHFSVLYNVGQAQIALGQHADAVSTLQRYLDEGGAEIDAKRRAEVEQVLARERERMPPFVAAPEDASPPPAAAPAPPATPAPAPPATPAAAPVTAPAAAAPSSPTAAVAPLTKPERSSLAEPPAVLPENQSTRRQSTARPGHARRARPPKASAASQRTLAYVVGAAGVLLSGGAVAHYAWNRERYRDWQGKFATYYRDPTEANRRDANTLSDSIDRASAVTVVLAVGAGVALGASGLLWVTSRPPSSDSRSGKLEPFVNVQGTF